MITRRIKNLPCKKSLKKMTILAIDFLVVVVSQVAKIMVNAKVDSGDFHLNELKSK
jgi:hypothetical protein